MTRSSLVLSALALATSVCAGSAMAKDTITFWFTDDDPNYVKRISELVDQFETKNPDIEVEFVTTGYSQSREQLSLQLSVGEGPDLAKYADQSLIKYTLDLRPYMDDPDAFAALHGNTLDYLRNKGDSANKIGGYLASQTLNLPFVNVTLFEQAGVPIPKPGSSLKDLVEASVKVADATGVDIPFTMDRSGHRFSGPAFSYGSVYVADNGAFTFPDEAAQAYIKDLYEWTQTGAFPKEMWGAAGGIRYKSMGDEFINANAVTYFAGNWMVNPFQKNIQDAFNWTVLDAPCGPGGCVPMPGTTYLTGFNRTKHPEAVAKLIEYLGSEPIQRELAENFIIIPGAEVKNINYKLDDENAKSAMTVFARNADKVSEAAINFYKALGSNLVYDTIVQRMSQLIVGELSLEETYERMASDIAKGNKELGY
ncbi:ABC transporter substrate-binding protein [Marinomonas sp. THO17]|uniref:ABC transporter substrate-binding protein n=1 Tax=Marinomonas sp. THO17 TaxID=3149048 RepID=UPI00336BC7C8